MTNEKQCEYLQICPFMMKGYCEFRDAYCCRSHTNFKLKEEQAEIERVRQVTLDSLPFALNDIGQVRVTQQIARQLRHEVPLTTPIEWEDYK